MFISDYQRISLQSLFCLSIICVLQESNSGHQCRWQVPLLNLAILPGAIFSDPSCQPSLFLKMSVLATYFLQEYDTYQKSAFIIISTVSPKPAYIHCLYPVLVIIPHSLTLLFLPQSYFLLNSQHYQLRPHLFEFPLLFNPWLSQQL